MIGSNSGRRSRPRCHGGDEFIARRLRLPVPEQDVLTRKLGHAAASIAASAGRYPEVTFLEGILADSVPFLPLPSSSAPCKWRFRKYVNKLDGDRRFPVDSRRAL